MGWGRARLAECTTKNNHINNFQVKNKPVTIDFVEDNAAATAILLLPIGAEGTY